MDTLRREFDQREIIIAHFLKANKGLARSYRKQCYMLGRPSARKSSVTRRRRRGRRTIDKKIVILSPGNLKAHLTVSMGTYGPAEEA